MVYILSLRDMGEKSWVRNRGNTADRIELYAIERKTKTGPTYDIAV